MPNIPPWSRNHAYSRSDAWRRTETPKKAAQQVTQASISQLNVFPSRLGGKWLHSEKRASHFAREMPRSRRGGRGHDRSSESGDGDREEPSWSDRISAVFCCSGAVYGGGSSGTSGRAACRWGRGKACVSVRAAGVRPVCRWFGVVDMIASFGIQSNSTSSPAASPTHHVSLRPHGFFAPSVMTWPSPRGTQAPKNQSVHPHKARHRQGASATRCAYFLHADGADEGCLSAP